METEAKKENTYEVPTLPLGHVTGCSSHVSEQPWELAVGCY